MRRLSSMAASGLLLITILQPAVAFAEETLDPAGIVADVVALDGKTVVLEGEAIGDILHGDDGHVWLNVLGRQSVAIGVWIDGSGPDSPREVISVLGDYNAIGDTVRIEGVVNAACDRHGGDLDVHAVSFSVIAAGTAVEHEADPLLGIAGVVLILISGVLVQVYRRRSIPLMEKD